MTKTHRDLPVSLYLWRLHLCVLGDRRERTGAPMHYVDDMNFLALGLVGEVAELEVELDALRSAQTARLFGVAYSAHHESLRPSASSAAPEIRDRVAAEALDAVTYAWLLAELLDVDLPLAASGQGPDADPEVWLCRVRTRPGLLANSVKKIGRDGSAKAWLAARGQLVELHDVLLRAFLAHASLTGLAQEEALAGAIEANFLRLATGAAIWRRRVERARGEEPTQALASQAYAAAGDNDDLNHLYKELFTGAPRNARWYAWAERGSPFAASIFRSK